MANISCTYYSACIVVSLCVSHIVVINTQATEMLDSTKHSSTTIEITVLDVNDNYPMFSHQQYNISIDETSEVGMTILTVNADDMDEVSCTLLGL